MAFVSITRPPNARVRCVECVFSVCAAWQLKEEADAAEGYEVYAMQDLSKAMQDFEDSRCGILRARCRHVSHSQGTLPPRVTRPAAACRLPARECWPCWRRRNQRVSRARSSLLPSTVFTGSSPSPLPLLLWLCVCSENARELCVWPDGIPCARADAAEAAIRWAMGLRVRTLILKSIQRASRDMAKRDRPFTTEFTAWGFQCCISPVLE